jgi:mannose-1-phosphate guanylyltransferase/phosphomannomutase
MTTRVAEQVARFHGVRITWTTTALDDLAEAASTVGTVLAADGRGGFVIPELSPAIDGVAALVRLVGLVARAHLSLSQIDARIPAAHLLRRDVPTAWAVKAQVMREVMQAAGDRTLDTTDGVRVVEEDGRWVLVLPDVSGAVTHLWAEGPDDDAASMLLEEWAGVVGRATLS